MGRTGAGGFDFIGGAGGTGGGAAGGGVETFGGTGAER